MFWRLGTMLERFFKAKSFRLHISKQKKIPENIFFDILKVRKSSRRGLLGGSNYILSQKSVPPWPFWRITSADLRFGVLEPVVGETVGGGLPPPTPSAWAPHRRSRHRSARFAKRAGTCLHVRSKWTEKRKWLRRQVVLYFL